MAGVRSPAQGHLAPSAERIYLTLDPALEMVQAAGLLSCPQGARGDLQGGLDRLPSACLTAQVWAASGTTGGRVRGWLNGSQQVAFPRPHHE